MADKRIEKRKEYNKKILELLERYLGEHEELRFIQALYALGIIQEKDGILVDKFYEEPYRTYVDCIAEMMKESMSKTSVKT